MMTFKTLAWLEALLLIATALLHLRLSIVLRITQPLLWALWCLGCAVFPLREAKALSIEWTHWLLGIGLVVSVVSFLYESRRATR